jgi:hypothetical protein
LLGQMRKPHETMVVQHPRWQPSEACAQHQAVPCSRRGHGWAGDTQVAYSCGNWHADGLARCVHEQYLAQQGVHRWQPGRRRLVNGKVRPCHGVLQLVRLLWLTFAVPEARRISRIPVRSVRGRFGNFMRRMAWDELWDELSQDKLPSRNK